MKKALLILIIYLSGLIPAYAQDCKIAQMRQLTEKYMSAQKAGDPQLLPLYNTLFIENLAVIDVSRSILNEVLPITFSRTFYDKNNCMSLSEIIVDDRFASYVMNVRLYIVDDKVTKIDSIITTDGDWEFDAKEFQKASESEKWNALSGAEYLEREEIFKIADAYLNNFTYENVKVAWGSICAHLEGGLKYTGNDTYPSCKLNMPGDPIEIVERDYFIDEDAGVVNIFCRFGKTNTESRFGATRGLPDSHTFRIATGKIRYIHSITVVN